MEREILFRGKRIDNGEWETGGLAYMRQGCSDESVYITDKMTGYLTPVDPATVGQYTGLTDKNGQKIYCWNRIADVNVTHWMPLPEPPETVEEDNLE